MKNILREYGFLTVLVLAGIGAYFLYQGQAGDLVEISLDSIGVRLDEMIKRPQDQAYVADLFDSFRRKVRAREVSPQEVERVVASILNMSREGVTLTPDEAKLLFEAAAIDSDSMRAVFGTAGAQTPPVPHPPSKSWEETGRNLTAALAFDEALAASVRDSAIRNRLWFDSKNGLKLVLEDTLRSILGTEGMEAFRKELRRLEQRDELEWRSTPRPPHVVPPVVVDSLLEDLPDRLLAKRELLLKLQSLEKKGFAPPANIDSLLDALDKRIHIVVDQTLDSALSSAGHKPTRKIK